MSVYTIEFIILGILAAIMLAIFRLTEGKKRFVLLSILGIVVWLMILGLAIYLGETRTAIFVVVMLAAYIASLVWVYMKFVNKTKQRPYQVRSYQPEAVLHPRQIQNAIQEINDINTLTLRPGKVYLGISLVCFGLAVLYWVGLSRAKPSDTPEVDLLISLAIVGIPLVLSIISVLFYLRARIVLNSSGISSRKLFGGYRCYSWDEITEVKAFFGNRPGLYRCEIYSNGRKVAVVTKGFIGYEQMLSCFRARGLL